MGESFIRCWVGPKGIEAIAIGGFERRYDPNSIKNERWEILGIKSDISLGLGQTLTRWNVSWLVE